MPRRQESGEMARAGPSCRVGAGTEGDLHGHQRPIRAWREERGFRETESDRTHILVSIKMDLKEK